MTNKKKKLSRKDKFKPLKKELIPMSTTPLFLKNTYEISIMTDSGLFQVEDGVFSKLYRLEIGDTSVKAQEVFTILRGYDCKYRIYHFQDNIYLSILFNSEKADVWVACNDLYKNMSSQFSELSISVEDIDANERMKIIHGLILDNENLPFYKSYMDNDFILDWKEDFELSSLREEIDYFFKKDDKYKIFYIREFSDNISKFISEISEMEDIKGIITQFDPVSDRAVQAFFKKNYMGTDNLLENMLRNNPDVYSIYTQEIKDDSRYFTMCGVIFLARVNDPEVEEKINFSAERYDIEVSYFHVNMIDIYKEFLPVGKWQLSESRVVTSEFASNILLSNYLAQEEQGESIDDFLLDIEVNEKTKEEDEKFYDIDEYDDDNDNYE